ncbi:hypothetical protein Taro_048483 [Colocasia esculenta]|uniref:Uncharacterized protein n=1 Tax=Colocasia esculenta TaxID=4460 RepID=A0A843X895_COLES|nr:hypothetical protein [Colocasia esculenta]
MRVGLCPTPNTPTLPGECPGPTVENQWDGGSVGRVDVEEVMYVVKELWHGRSVKDQSTKDVGRKMWRSVNELMLVRWDRRKPATVTNLVLLKFEEVDEHESTSIDIIKERDPEYFEMVTCVLKCAEREFAL